MAIMRRSIQTQPKRPGWYYGRRKNSIEAIQPRRVVMAFGDRIYVEAENGLDPLSYFDWFGPVDVCEEDRIDDVSGAAVTALPDKPSELIRLALSDLAKVEAMPDVYTVNTSYFHMPSKGTCMVGIFGAVIAMTLGALNRDCFWPKDYKPDVSNKLLAIDSFSCGNVNLGLRDMGIYNFEMPFQKITLYVKSKHLFRSDMERLASDLEAEGL